MEELNSLANELAKVIAKERASLEQCKDFLSMLASLQVDVTVYFVLEKKFLLNPLMTNFPLSHFY